MQTEEQPACTAPSSPSRWSRWVRRLAAYSGAQGIVLLVNALSGFLLVRGMSKEHYAWFTIANSLLATINILSDSGLGSAMMSIGGNVCEDRSRFASLMRVARGMRFRFMTLAALVTLPAGWWVLDKNGAPWPVIVGLLCLVIFTSLPAAEGVVLSTINKLHRRVSYLLQADFCMSLSRLAMVALGMFAGLTAIFATAATAIAQWMQVMLLRRQTSGDLAITERVEEHWKPEINRVVRALFPLCLFNCVQGHITTWLLSVVATTHDVADVGALTRLGVVFTFLGLPLTQLVCPLISRTKDPRRLAKLCLVALGGSILAALGLIMAGVVLSDQVLWLLGAQYSHLHRELAWFLAAQALGVAANAAWGIAYTRSWVRYGWLQIPFTVLLQCISAAYLNLSQVSNAIFFASISSIVGFVIASILIIRGLNNHISHYHRMQSP